MTRHDFMETLDKYLQRIPAEERADILAYYHEYFEDAQIKDTDEVPSSVASPYKIAMDCSFETKYSAVEEKQEQGKRVSTWTYIGLACLGILALPFGLVVLAVAFSLLVVILSVIFSLLLLSVTSLFFFFFNLFKLNLLNSFGNLGIGLLSTGLSLFAVIFIRWTSLNISRKIRRKKYVKNI